MVCECDQKEREDGREQKMSVGVIFQEMIVIFLLIFVGYLLFHGKMISEQSSADLSTMVVKVCSPALILVSALEGCHNLKNDQVFWGFILAGGLYLVLILCGLLLPFILKVHGVEARQYRMMTIFGNTGFIGIPVALAVFGTDAMVYVTIFNIYFNLLVYTYGIYQVNQCGAKRQQPVCAKMFLNPGNIANLAAIAIFIFKPQIPEIGEEFINYVGNATVFLSMVIVGGFLARAPLREIFSEKRIYLFVLLRQILLPVILTLILKMWIKNPIMLGTCMLMVAMPVGNMALILAEQVGADGRILSKGIIVTTLGAIVTIPLVALCM